MEIGFYNIGKTVGISQANNILTFFSSKPIMIQPSEIMKVPIGVILNIEENYYIQLATHPSLIDRVCTIFPAFTILDSALLRKELYIPVMNCGRNPFNIMAEQPIAVGYGHTTEGVEINLTNFDPQVTLEEDNKRSLPQKKNTGIRFELK